MEVTDNKGQIVKVFNFSETYEPPKYKWNKGIGIVEWGTKNIYPQFILDLYNSKGSSRHKSIVNKKVKFIAGNGIFEVQNPKLNTIIKENKLNKQIRKAALDYELFNGFAFEVIWDRGGNNITDIQAIPFHKLRLGIVDNEIDMNQIWYSHDWSKHRKEENTPEAISLFNPKKPGGKQIYYYTEYNPESDGLYPIVGYSSGINWIDLHFRISTYHLAQVKNGYAPSFLLNFATGIPSEEEQDAFFKEFKREFKGEQNSGKIIITYSEGKEQAPTFEKIDMNDSDKRFIMLADQIKEEIVSSHEVPAPMFILTPGKLASTDERKELADEFQYTYVDQRQESLEEVLNDIFSTVGIDEEIKLKTYRDARYSEVKNVETVEVREGEDEQTEEQINE